MNPPRSQRSRLAGAVTLALLATSARVQSATFVWNNPNGGALNVAANWSPSGIPGSGDTARFQTQSNIASGLTYLVNANQSLARIEYDTFAQGVIDGTAILTVPQIVTSNTIIESPSLTGNALTIRTVIAGNSGLLVQGGGFVALSNVNTFSGTVNLVGNGTTGGVSIDADGRLGSIFNPVTMSQAGTLRAISTFATTRSFTLGTGGGRFETFGNLTIAGNIGGSGNFHHDRFTSGSLILSGANGLTGSSFFNDGSTTVLSGSLLQSQINLSGNFVLLADAGVAITNRMSDSLGVTSFGGTITVNARDANITESTGALALSSGMTSLNLLPTATTSASINFASLSRTTSTLYVSGNDLGNGAAASNRARVTFTSNAGLPMIGGGGSSATNESIVPFAYGLANPSAPDSAAPVTIAATGLRELTDT
ncbi:MAG TPA: hypothetical protein PK402_10080, partial [Tepidisphaeraceae bacterium]|nr:hypothetical protein [Tepidisphaeraceae bacterium]